MLSRPTYASMRSPIGCNSTLEIFLKQPCRRPKTSSDASCTIGISTPNEVLSREHRMGGALIVYETLIPEDRRRNAAGLLASLNMLLWTAGGF